MAVERTRTGSRLVVRIVQALAWIGALVWMIGAGSLNGGGAVMLIFAVPAIVGAGLLTAVCEGLLALFDIADNTRAMAETMDDAETRAAMAAAKRMPPSAPAPQAPQRPRVLPGAGNG